MYLALAVLLPVGFHMLGVAGRIFLPMHIPVLLAGFLVGPYCGLIVGLIAPGLSFLLTVNHCCPSGQYPSTDSRPLQFP